MEPPDDSFLPQVEITGEPEERLRSPALEDEVEVGIEIAMSLCNDSFFSSNELIFEAVTLFESSSKNRASAIAHLKLCLEEALINGTVFQDDEDARKLVLLTAVLQCKRKLYLEAGGYLKFLMNTGPPECDNEIRVLKQYFKSMPKLLDQKEIDSAFLSVAAECVEEYYCIVEEELRFRRLAGVGLIKVQNFDDGFLYLCDVLEEQLKRYRCDYHNVEVVATLTAVFDNLEDLTEHFVSFKVVRRVYELVKLKRRDVDERWRFCEVYVRMLLSGEYTEGLRELQEIFEDGVKCFRNLPGSDRAIQVMRAVLGRYYQGCEVKEPLEKYLDDFKKATEAMDKIGNLEDNSLPSVVIEERKENEMRVNVKNMVESSLNALHQLRNVPSKATQVFGTLKTLNNKAWTVLKPNDPYLFLTAKTVTLASYLVQGRPKFAEAKIVSETVQKFEENLGSDHPLHVRALIHKLHLDVKRISEWEKPVASKKFRRNCNRALELAERIFGNCHEETASAKLILGRALAMCEDRREDATNCIYEAAKIMEEAVGPFWKNPMAYNHWKRVAHAFEKAQELEAALRYAGKWREAVKKFPPDPKAWKAMDMVKRLEKKAREMD